MQLAREVNEAIAEIGRRFEVGDAGLDFFCECGAEGCLERLSLTISAFESVLSRSEPLLVEGHPLVHTARARSASALTAQSARQLARVGRLRRARADGVTK